MLNVFLITLGILVIFASLLVGGFTALGWLLVSEDDFPGRLWLWQMLPVFAACLIGVTMIAVGAWRD